MNSGANPFDDNPPETMEEPSWMAPPAPAPSSKPAFTGETQPAAATGGRSPSLPASNERYMGRTGPEFIAILRVLHILTGIGIVFAGVFAFVQGKSASSTVIAALYTIFLGLILIGSEIKIPKFDEFMRSNFGFLYGFRGKAAYLVFASVFPLSLGAVGITFGCVAIANCLFDSFIILKHPYFRSTSAADQSAYQPPSNV